MGYATVADVRDALDPLGAADDPTSAAGLPDARLQDSLDDAQAEIDARLAGKATMPLTNPPPLIKTITVDVAAYLATLLYSGGEPLPQGHPVLLRYARAQQLLTGLQNGSIPLDVSQGPAETAVDPDTVVNAYEDAIFTRDDVSLGHDLDGRYRVDPFAHRWG